MKTKFTIKPKNITAASDLTDWPASEEIDEFEFSDELEALWEYINEPEERVFHKFQIFAEPSVQGHAGAMFLFDESGEDRDAIEVNWPDWIENECELARQSENADDYYNLFYDYIEKLVDQYWS